MSDQKTGVRREPCGVSAYRLESADRRKEFQSGDQAEAKASEQE